MDFVDRLMLAYVQPSHQQDDIQAIGKTWQGQCIGLRTPVRSLMSRTLAIGAAIARMNQLHHSAQSDHGSLRQRHRLPQLSMAVEALMLNRSIPRSYRVRIAAGAFHRRTPCFNLTEILFASVYHTSPGVHATWQC